MRREGGLETNITWACGVQNAEENEWLGGTALPPLSVDLNQAEGSCTTSAPHTSFPLPPSPLPPLECAHVGDVVMQGSALPPLTLPSSPLPSLTCARVAMPGSAAPLTRLGWTGRPVQTR